MEFFELNIKYARLMGYWHPTHNKYYELYTLMHICFMLLFGFSQIVYIIVYDVSFVELVRMVHIVFLPFLTTYRLIVWMNYEQRIRDMLHFMKIEQFNEIHPIVQRAHKIAFYYSLFIIGFPYLHIIITFGPILQVIIQYNTYDNINLPYHTWLPFDMYDNGWEFFLRLLFQMYTYWISSTCLTVIHASVLCLMIKINAHFQLLAEEIATIDVYAMDAEQQLDHYLQEYHNIYKYARQIENLNSLQWIGQISEQAYALCAALILTAYLPISESGSDIFLGVSALFDLFLYCFFGEEIFFQSNRVSIKLCEIDWYAGSKTFRQKYLTSLAVLAPGITFKIGGFFLLRLPTFIQIVKLSYSMYTLMNTFS